MNQYVLSLYRLISPACSDLARFYSKGCLLRRELILLSLSPPFYILFFTLTYKSLKKLFFFFVAFSRVFENEKPWLRWIVLAFLSLVWRCTNVLLATGCCMVNLGLTIVSFVSEVTLFSLMRNDLEELCASPFLESLLTDLIFRIRWVRQMVPPSEWSREIGLPNGYYLCLQHLHPRSSISSSRC